MHFASWFEAFSPTNTNQSSGLLAATLDVQKMPNISQEFQDWFQFKGSQSAPSGWKQTTGLKVSNFLSHQY